MFLAFAAMILLLDSRATAQDDNDIDVRNDHTLLKISQLQITNLNLHHFSVANVTGRAAEPMRSSRVGFNTLSKILTEIIT